MPTKVKYALHPLFLVAALFAVAQLGSSVKAMAVYNNTPGFLNLYFSCGFFCDNSWTIEPNTSKSRPGTSGSLDIWLNGMGAGACTVEVDQHGWVDLTPDDPNDPSNPDVLVTSFHQDGSTHESCSFDPGSY